ncbi:MAG: sensor histidine kinase, partial [Flavobacteriaceae bacterium]|nr:sensor histidine kinase [Flavobacteriaceae bacterium]
KLYQGKNLAAIDMKDYLINLGKHIMDSFQTDDRINLAYKGGTVELDVDAAIPIGLIVNELITNALKYAFPDKSKGTIEIVLHKQQENKLFLEVADDGIGQEEGHSKKDGFGTQLINLLVQQMDGKSYSDTKNGTKISFEFNLNSL